MRDFLNGLDNLHEYMRFSYPKLKPPSFFVEKENPNGLLLHYRSKRKGYLYYVKGQIKQVLTKKSFSIDILSYLNKKKKFIKKLPPLQQIDIDIFRSAKCSTT